MLDEFNFLVINFVKRGGIAIHQSAALMEVLLLYILPDE